LAEKRRPGASGEGLAVRSDPADRRLGKPAASQRRARRCGGRPQRDEADGAAAGGEPALLAFEMRRDVARQALRSPVEDDDDFAAHVEPAIVGEAVFRRIDPEAGEDRRAL
jgi:hypothetical protein